jgi:hypothetical protein
MNDPRGTSSSPPAISFLTFCGLGLAVVAGAGTVPAQAATVPTGSTSVFCSVEGNSFMNPTACEFGAFPGVPSSAAAEAEINPIPRAFATATTPSNGVLGAGASATLAYFFQVDGPTVGVRIPILIDYFLLSESTFESKAIARMILSTTAGTFEGFEVCSDGTCEETQISDTLQLEVLTGSTRDSVTLFAQAQAFVTGFSTETALAVADPYIYIDPAFPDASLYSIVVSPGFGNAPAPVPEAATVYYLSAGLCLLAWCGRQARRTRRVAAGNQKGVLSTI